MSGMAGRRVILLEFNELCRDLLADWMAKGLLPNFQEFYSKSRVFTAHADVTEQDHLEPWIQWYSLHTGFSYEQHRVFHLTDGPKRGLKDIWQLLLENGYRVGNCAGMNSPGFVSEGSFYLPDPWCNSQKPYPPEMQAYQLVVLTNVQENTNISMSLDRNNYFEFLKFWMTHGLTAKSVAKILRQLLLEARDKRHSWRRAALLDKIQFDIFSHYWRSLEPDFASFFINSTAHFQHAYFHLLKPESFEHLANAPEDRLHKDAILFGYREMDKLLGQFFELEKRGALLVFSTALSQRPNPLAGLHYYRPRDIHALLRAIGVHPTRLLPVMAHQYSAEFDDRASAEASQEKLQTIRYRGAPVFDLSSARPKSLFFGVGLHTEIPDDASLEFVGAGPSAVRFHDLFYRVPHTKSGVHQAESSLWFKTGDLKVSADKVSILDVLPTLLDYYGVEAPEEEGMSRPGKSILPMLDIGHYRSQSAALSRPTRAAAA
jgi:hypothetical protein